MTEPHPCDHNSIALGRNATAVRSYDELNRIRQQTYTDATPTVSYTYDSAMNGKGMLATAANGNSVTNYTQYDAMGGVVSSNQVTGGQVYPFGYGYNLAGALTSETYPSGRVLTTTYDPAGRMSQLAGSLGGNTTTYVSNVSYAPQGTATQYKYGNDLWRQATYNNRLQPDTTTDQVSNNPSNLLLKLTWDWGGMSSNGNVMGLNANHGALSFNQTFGYDALNRLHTASDTGGWSRTSITIAMGICGRIRRTRGRLRAGRRRMCTTAPIRLQAAAMMRRVICSYSAPAR